MVLEGRDDAARVGGNVAREPRPRRVDLGGVAAPDERQLWVGGVGRPCGAIEAEEGEAVVPRAEAQRAGDAAVRQDVQLAGLLVERERLGIGAHAPNLVDRAYASRTGGPDVSDLGLPRRGSAAAHRYRVDPGRLGDAPGPRQGGQTRDPRTNRSRRSGPAACLGRTRMGDRTALQRWDLRPATGVEAARGRRGGAAVSTAPALRRPSSSAAGPVLAPGLRCRCGASRSRALADILRHTAICRAFVRPPMHGNIWPCFHRSRGHGFPATTITTFGSLIDAVSEATLSPARTSDALSSWRRGKR